MTEEPRYTIGQLAETAGVTPRTIRYYTTEGLLPPPLAEGRCALYNESHLNRLRLIQRLKSAFLPLEAIRAQLTGLNDGQVESLLVSCTPAQEAKPAKGVRMRVRTAAPHSQQSSEDYIAQILAVTGQAAMTDAPVESPSKPRRALLVSSIFASPKPDETADETAARVPDVWERVRLDENAELHLRVPASPEDRARLERLIAATQALFQTDNEN